MLLQWRPGSWERRCRISTSPALFKPSTAPPSACESGTLSPTCFGPSLPSPLVCPDNYQACLQKAPVYTRLACKGCWFALRLANMFQSMLTLPPGMAGQLSGLSTKSLHADHVIHTPSLMSPWFCSTAGCQQIIRACIHAEWQIAVMIA